MLTIPGRRTWLDVRCPRDLCRASGDLLGQANALTSLGLCRRVQGDAVAGAEILLRHGDPAGARPFLVGARAIYQRSHAPEIADVEQILDDL